MNLIAALRTKTARLASASGGLFVVLWLALAMAPCALAMQVPDAGHDCPHCPPAPCHEVQPEQCNEPDSMDAPRVGEKFELPELFLPAQAPAWAAEVQPAHGALPRPHTPIRAGPRPHLVFQRFNE